MKKKNLLRCCKIYSFFMKKEFNKRFSIYPPTTTYVIILQKHQPQTYVLFIILSLLIFHPALYRKMKKKQPSFVFLKVNLFKVFSFHLLIQQGEWVQYSDVDDDDDEKSNTKKPTPWLNFSFPFLGNFVVAYMLRYNFLLLGLVSFPYSVFFFTKILKF